MLTRLTTGFSKLATRMHDFEERAFISSMGGLVSGFIGTGTYVIHNNVKHRGTNNCYSRIDSSFYIFMGSVSTGLASFISFSYPPVSLPLVGLFGVAMLTSKKENNYWSKPYD